MFQSFCFQVQSSLASVSTAFHQPRTMCTLNCARQHQTRSFQAKIYDLAPSSWTAIFASSLYSSPHLRTAPSSSPLVGLDCCDNPFLSTIDSRICLLVYSIVRTASSFAVARVTRLELRSLPVKFAKFVVSRDGMAKVANRVCLIVIDGWGISEESDGNAILNAKTPVMDGLCSGIHSHC